MSWLRAAARSSCQYPSTLKSDRMMQTLRRRRLAATVRSASARSEPRPAARASSRSLTRRSTRVRPLAGATHDSMRSLNRQAPTRSSLNCADSARIAATQTASSRFSTEPASIEADRSTSSRMASSRSSRNTLE